MVETVRVAAVDLGASSGRVAVGEVGPDRLTLDEVHRFANHPVRAGDTLYWDVLGLYREILVGLRRAGPVRSIGIDSWAVDYGLLDASGRLLGNPVCYRDGRTEGVADQVLDVVPAEQLYATTGIQQLPFNTVYQLVADPDAASAAQTMLMIPDLLGYWLTGAIGAERTNASTTQLYDVRTGRWATGLAERLGIPSRILPPIREPGDIVGSLRPEVAAELDLPPSTPVMSVGSHDTASAVVAAPFEPGANAAYISSGTWSLVGLELGGPILTEAARQANFTNEVGIDGTIRFLKNVMGLWVITEMLRAWGRESELATLLVGALGAPPLQSVVDVDDLAFLPPGDMESRIVDACRRTGQPVPRTRAEFVRCVLESLALAYRRAVRLAASLSGQPIETVHIVGGGAQNALLCQLTADACGVPVVAGPTEATILGNVLVQARAHGAEQPDLAAMRATVRATHELRHYEPAGDLDWDDAEARIALRQRP